ncbi:MAG: Ig-like domain-containing protein [Prevotellaceae bacterium]|jgi:uncharacterized protein YjdB|nr:Ig-like domain-containing protein [Prevotellaceae bacterium]
MKKNVLKGLFAIMIIATASCQNEESFDTGINPGTIVEAQFQPVIPASITNLSSGNGGTGNLEEVAYDLRYILEVWSDDGSTLITRETLIADNYATPVNFSVHLPAAMYKFVFWADFVATGTEDDLTYDTGNAGGLKEIEWTASAYAISDNLRDAYYAVETVDLTSSNVNGSVTLKRPFGKLRILATDLYDESIVPTKAIVTYTHAGTPSFRNSFNALTGEPNATTIDATGSFESVPELEASVTAGESSYSNVYLLAFDYFLVPADLTAVSFDIELLDSTTPIAPAKSISNVPLGVNKLTTVIGAFLPLFVEGDAAFSVIVDDDFDNDDAFTTAIASVSLNKTELELFTNEQETLTVTVLPANAANKNVTWSSNAEGIATVDQSGEVTAVAVGSATITVTSNANGLKTAICGVTVNAVPTPGSISLDDVADATAVELTYTDATTENLTVTGGAINPTTALKTIKSIKIGDGNPILIGRKANSNINLKINGTAIAFRDDADGFIPIGTYAEFQLISTALAGSYKMETDLDLMNENWESIGNAANENDKFTGTFDGNHHSVSNLYVNKTGNTWGLFRYLSGSAVIKNLGIESGSLITTGGGMIGAFAGKMEGTASITGCYNKASVTVSANQAGGIVGWSVSGTDCKIIACYNAGAIKGGSYVGGIVGYFTGTLNITACYNTGEVTGTGSSVAGIVPDATSVTACYNTGTITQGSGTALPVSNYNKCTAGYALNTTNAAKVKIFSDTDWPSSGENAEWGVGDGSGSGTYWRSLGNWNGGNPVFPKLFFEE